MSELIWLLLPIAAASGWYAAKRSAAKGISGQYNELSSDYFKGLNYLLNEQPDKAIEVFIKMVEVDSETVETHLALGSLFRRRGEVDRAIRVHQNLIARPTLNDEQKTHALLELGDDYMKAGLFDRAEDLFLELLDLNTFVTEALVHLLDIYQQEQDWDKAISICQRLDKITDTSRGHVIAHYYCELADKALAEHDDEVVSQLIKKALSYDKNCVRASMLQGQLEITREDYNAAIAAYKRVAHQDPDFLPEVIGLLETCYKELGDQESLDAYLHEVSKINDSITLIIELAELIRLKSTDQEAMAFVADQLRKKPSVRGLSWVIEVSLKHSDGKARDNLLTLSDLISKLLEGKPVYECNKCGFTGKSMHWQCPSCQSWNSVKPIKGVEGE